MSDNLIAPHGGTLVDLLVSPERAAELMAPGRGIPEWSLTPRQLNDIELLINGGFSPLTGFMTSADYESVKSNMRLADGTLWPMPIMLDVTEAVATASRSAASSELRDPEGVLIAVLHVEDVWQPDLAAEAAAVFGSSDPGHPGVAHLMRATNPYYVGGRLEALQLPVHYDFRALRRTPAQLPR